MRILPYQSQLHSDGGLCNRAPAVFDFAHYLIAEYEFETGAAKDYVSGRIQRPVQT